MAILRLTLSNIETEILRIAGFNASTDADWATSANLYRIVNDYMQALPMRAASITAQEAAASDRRLESERIRFDMWKTTANLTATSGGSTVDFPTDYDQYESFYDNTNAARIHPVAKVDKWHIRKLKDKPPGPPEAIEILGFVTSGSNWVRRGVLYPDTMAGITPSIRCTYWRLPAIMPGTDAPNEYPDIDIKYQHIAIWGTLTRLLMPGDPLYDKATVYERELITDMVKTGASYAA